MALPRDAVGWSTVCDCTVTPVLSGRQKHDKMVFNTDYCLMQVKIITCMLVAVD